MQKSKHESKHQKHDHEQPQHQNVPTASDDLIPIMQVNGSNEFLVTGIAYAIRNSHHGGFLHAGGKGGSGDRSFVQNYGPHSWHRQWVIQRNLNQFALRNVRHNNAYLHAGERGGTEDRAFVQNGIKAGLQHWNFQHQNSNRIGIRNVRHSDAFLHSGEIAGTGDRAFVQDGIDGLFQSWEFDPQRFEMKMRVFDIIFYENAQPIVRERTDVRLMNRQKFEIDESRVGSSVSTTFTSTVNERFTWSLNQKLNVSVSLDVSAELPAGVGSVPRTFSGSATVGSEQTWSNQQTSEFSVTANFVPPNPGTFQVAGFMDVADNLQLRYKAFAQVTIMGPRMTNQGVIAENMLMPGIAVVSYLKFASRDFQIIQVRPNSVIARVSGVVTSTYGLRSHFTSRQIG